MSNLQRELCLACHGGASDDQPRIRIVSPPDRTIVPEERLALIGKTSGRSPGPLAVKLNGAKFQLPVRGDAFFTWLTLQEGVNRIEIVQEERLLWAGEVFRGDGGTSGYRRRSVGHCTGSRQECLGCHDEQGAKIARNASDLSALCYGCHDRFEGKRFLHGPLAVGACLACHDPHSGYGSAHLRDDQAPLCGTCHAPREAAATAACIVEGKVCADCHDPHQSDVRYLLKGPKYTMGGAVPAQR
jgi:predicted CXXCH cytochrome family protein